MKIVCVQFGVFEKRYTELNLTIYYTDRYSILKDFQMLYKKRELLDTKKTHLLGRMD